jgi:hypothetical protein
MIEQRIRNYLSMHSKGVINISDQHARKIIDMVLEFHRGERRAFVKLHQWRPQTRTWELYRTLFTTDEEINLRIKDALEKGPQMDFFMFELYNSEGEHQGRIYTTNRFLFQP